MPINGVHFINYPEPKESITTRQRAPPANNPVLSGWLLTILSRILAASTFAQKLFWHLNGFDKLKHLPELEGYQARFDPCVIPVNQNAGEQATVRDLPKPKNRKHQKNYYTIADYYDAYVSGTLTPLDVAEYILPLISRSKDGKTTKWSVAYLDVQPELVRAAARSSTERYKSGNPLSVLDGVPIAVKDEVHLKGHSKSLGSRLDFKPTLDETVWCVKMWEDAGAVILGKTNMHELGLDTTNNNPTWGTPLNPHNEGYYTGGSSGGSGCTVAQGICPIALGVDGGGSNRVSVHPTEHGANSLAVCGPMSPSIDDLAIAYRVMAQPCSTDVSSKMFPSTLSTGAMTVATSDSRSLGIDRDWVAQSEPEVLEVFNAAVDYYTKEQGYQVIDIKIPMQTENQKAFSLTILAESMTALTSEKLKQLQPANQILLNVSGIHATAQDLISCARIRERAMRHLAWLWTQHPGMLVLTPTMPVPGIKIRKPSDISDGYGFADPDTCLRSMEYTSFGNWTGAPAITCPGGYSTSGIPIGIMALAEWGSEEQLITFAQHHEPFLGDDGVRKPKQRENWVDVLAEAKKR